MLLTFFVHKLQISALNVGYFLSGSRWHSRGQRFDPAYLHHKTPTFIAKVGVFLTLGALLFGQKVTTKFRVEFMWNESEFRALFSRFWGASL